MARTPDKPHNAASLRSLADQLREKAKTLDELAEQLQAVAGKKAVRVGHQKKIDAGVLAIESMRLEVLDRINSKQFTNFGR